MIRTWLPAFSYTAVVVAAFLLALWAAARNWSQFRQARAIPPLDVAEILSTPQSAISLPRQWPAPASIENYRVASAYRDCARARREIALLFGEVAVLVGGAALGASLPRFFEGGAKSAPTTVAATIAVLGLMYRNHEDQRWTQIAASYERRRVERLPIKAPSPPAPPRRRWLQRFFRRREPL